MSRPIVLGVAALLLFAFGVIAANTHIAQGVISVTSYEADVNKDAHVNVADIGLVASKYGQVVVTATPVSPLRTYTVFATSSHLPNSIVEATAVCDQGDSMTSGGPVWGMESIRDLTESREYRQQSLGLSGWYASWSDDLGYQVFVICLDSPPSSVRLTPTSTATPTSTPTITPTALPCPPTYDGHYVGYFGNDPTGVDLTYAPDGLTGTALITGGSSSGGFSFSMSCGSFSGTYGSFPIAGSLDPYGLVFSGRIGPFDGVYLPFSWTLEP